MKLFFFSLMMISTSLASGVSESCMKKFKNLSCKGDLNCLMKKTRIVGPECQKQLMAYIIYLDENDPCQKEIEKLCGDRVRCPTKKDISSISRKCQSKAKEQVEAVFMADKLGSSCAADYKKHCGIDLKAVKMEDMDKLGKCLSEKTAKFSADCRQMMTKPTSR